VGSEMCIRDRDKVGFFQLFESPGPLAFPTDELVLAALRDGAIRLIPESPAILCELL